MSLTKEILVEYMVRHLGLRQEELSNDALLFSTGLLDSLSLLDLIAFIEKHAKIRISAAEINLDNLDSIERILSFVDQPTNA